MVYRPLWYDTEDTITTGVVPSEIDERLMDRLWWWVYPCLRDR